MTLYIYNPETREIVGRIHGATNQACESELANHCCDEYAATYSPAIGANGGLVDAYDVEDIYV